MNKLTAHLVLAALDIAALAACYYVVSEWSRINQMISDASESITMQSHLGFYTLLIMIPIIHLSTLIKWQDSAKKWGNRMLIALFLLFITGAYTLGSHLEDKLLSSGYHYCAEQSKTMTFSEFRTFLKDNKKCLEEIT